MGHEHIVALFVQQLQVQQVVLAHRRMKQVVKLQNHHKAAILRHVAKDFAGFLFFRYATANLLRLHLLKGRLVFNVRVTLRLYFVISRRLGDLGQVANGVMLVGFSVVVASQTSLVCFAGPRTRVNGGMRNV